MSSNSDATRAFETKLMPQITPGVPSGRTLDKRLVHKSYDESVLVSHIEAVQPPAKVKKGSEDAALERTDHFRGIPWVHRDHPLYFDRDRGHVHGIFLMEAAQQTVMATAHLFYGVPLDGEFVLTECSAQFRSVANMDDPLIAEVTMSDHVYRKGRLVRMQSAVVIRQGNLERARMSGTMVLLSKDQLKYLEQRAPGNF
jgi:hypothetical protein